MHLLARASRLPKNKRWRFAADAMDMFRSDEGFLARQMTDTQYLSRMALEYLEALYPKEEADRHGVLAKRNHVRVVPGRLTELFRRNWGLNNLLPDHNLGDEMAQAKNRKDHRHNAIDAAVVGVTSRSLLQRISSAAARLDDVDFANLVKNTVKDNPPWKGFREDLQEALRRIVVSHKPDHGTVSRQAYGAGKGQTAGKLHNDTAYGLTGKTDAKGNSIVVRRKPFLSLEPKDVASIRDEELRSELFSAVGGLKDKKEIQAALMRFRKDHPKFKGIRRVRVVEPLAVIPIRDREGNVYKGYKGGSNYRYVVWPLQGHHAQGARMRAQIDAGKPLQKQLWQKIVAAKVRMQGHVLAANGREAGAFDLLARRVRSGDPDNIEAQAARRYWKALFGPDFYRDQDAAGINSMLNYGYTVLRAIVSRAICASGLHPTIGIFHSNRANAFALSDDLMEPYRPMVDQMVFNLAGAGETELTPEVKRVLASISTFDLRGCL